MSIQFHRPHSLPDALRLKQQLGSKAFFLAGGTELNNLHSRIDVEHLIDIQNLGLDELRAEPAALYIGARVRVQALLESSLVPPCLRQAASHMANRNIRNVATIGGQLGSNRACADLLPALLALYAEVELATVDGEQRIPLCEWSDAQASSLILRFIVPLQPERQVAVAAHSRTANDLSIITAAAGLRREAGLARDVVLALGGVAAHGLRLREVEARLEGQALPAQDELEAMIAQPLTPISDHRGSAAFKRQLAAVLGARALHQAFNEASPN
ncbi:MAG: FAD binding domain-containing protein [Myxococcota bacterium]|nr:FAD binding domain-containing protein [Myxococcota bacterium]